MRPRVVTSDTQLCSCRAFPTTAEWPKWPEARPAGLPPSSSQLPLLQSSGVGQDPGECLTFCSPGTCLGAPGTHGTGSSSQGGGTRGGAGTAGSLAPSWFLRPLLAPRSGPELGLRLSAELVLHQSPEKARLLFIPSPGLFLPQQNQVRLGV